MVFSPCFWGAVFYILPVYCFYYVPSMVILTPFFIHKYAPTISLLKALLYTLYILIVSITLFMIVGLYYVGFLPFDCFMYLHNPVAFSVMQISALVIILVFLQTTALGYKRGVTKAIFIANVIVALIMLMLYYVLFLSA